MQKINKKRKKLQLGDLKRIRFYKKSVEQKSKYFANLIKSKKLKQPFWYKKINSNNFKNLAFKYFLPGSTSSEYRSTNASYLNKDILTRYRLKPDRKAFKVWNQYAKDAFKPNYFDKLGKRFIGPRTQRSWWLEPKDLRQYRLWYKIRSGLMPKSASRMWNPLKQNKLRAWLYLSKKIFKNAYGISQTKKLQNIIKSSMKSKNPNKINLFIQQVESQLQLVVLRMGFASSLRSSFYYIKKGIVFVNGVRVTNPTFKLKPDDVVQIKFHFTTINPKTVTKLRRLEGWSYLRKKKQYKHLHVDYRSLRGIFLEYPTFDQNRKNILMNDPLGYSLYAYLFSQMRNI
jgi:ribosomal protein S4